MMGKNRIMIYGPKNDGTYVVEFMTAATCFRSRSRGTEAHVTSQERVPYGLFVPGDSCGGLGTRVRPEAFLPATKSENWVTVSPIVILASPLEGVEAGRRGNGQMQSEAQTAWETAARCAALAQETADPQEREHYERMRDAWITLANRYEFLNMSDLTE
jgi:hypothetical protein